MDEQQILLRNGVHQFDAADDGPDSAGTNTLRFPSSQRLGWM
jgi:hypothetical protein